MKLGVLTTLYADRSFEAVLYTAKEAGLDCVEIGTGNYPGDAHIDVVGLLASEAARRSYLDAVSARGLEISALSCHGNPLHPQRDKAIASHDVFRRTVEVAGKLGVPCVNLFSGCPGDSEEARFPNWVTCAWPTDFQEILEWQWKEKVIPYWKAQAAFAKSNGVRLAFEMHPGFVVYNNATLLRLREACGEAVGAQSHPIHPFRPAHDRATAPALGCSRNPRFPAGASAMTGSRGAAGGEVTITAATVGSSISAWTESSTGTPNSAAVAGARLPPATARNRPPRLCFARHSAKVRAM